MGGVLDTHRQCSVEIGNKCSEYFLSNPSVYMDSGSCAIMLPPKIEDSRPVDVLFKKTPHTARGAVGVFTYNICEKSTKKTFKKMAVTFHVPYDYNLYSNWFAVGIFDSNTECDYRLYKHMENSISSDLTCKRKNPDSCIEFDRHGISISATMSDSGQSDMKVVVRDD